MSKEITELDKEIVQQLADGLTIAELANKTGLGVAATESKVFRLRQTWGLKSVAALCVFFYKKGWIK